MTKPQKEMPVLKHVMMKASKLGLRIFRNNTGKLQDARGRWVSFGLCEGSSDLIGITPVTITPDMIGLKLGIFTAIEVKAPGWKYNPKDGHEKQQMNFIDQIVKLGGIAFFINNEQDLGDNLTRFVKLAVDRPKQLD